VGFLLEHYKKVKLSQNMKGEFFAFIPNRELTSALVLEISQNSLLKNIFSMNLKENDRNHEKLMENTGKIIENASLFRKEEEFKDSVLFEICKYALQYNLFQN